MPIGRSTQKSSPTSNVLDVGFNLTAINSTHSMANLETAQADSGK